MTLDPDKDEDHVRLGTRESEWFDEWWAEWKLVGLVSTGGLSRLCSAERTVGGSSGMGR